MRRRLPLAAVCLTACLVIAASARAQPCGSRECHIRMLDVAPFQLAQAAERITELRRVARDDGATPGARVAALREQADLFASISHRARRARELGALEEPAARAFERVVGRRPEALDAAPVARACVALARSTYAWAYDAGRCLSLARGLGAEVPIEERLAWPFVARAFADAREGDAAVAVYRDVLARAGDPTDVRARLELAAIQLAVGRRGEAIATLEALPDRSSYDAQLAWAEAAAANGRQAEALATVTRLAREAPSRSAAVFDAMVLVDALRSPSDRAASARVLAAAQHFLCVTPESETGLREAAQELGAMAAEELGLDELRPLVPLRFLPSYHVDQERARPLATCARARTAFVRGSSSVRTPPARPCPDGVLAGFDEDGRAGWVLRRGRVTRVPERCLQDAATSEEDELDELVDRFDLGDLDADGQPDVALVGDATDGTYTTGRELRLLSGRDPSRVLATLRDPSARFGAAVVPAGDVNDDGVPDVIVTRPSACDCCDCSGQTDDALLYLGQEGGGLRLAATIRGPDGVQNWIRAIGAGDLDADGFDDVVIAHGAQVRFHRGRREGVDPTGVVVHRRESHSDGLVLGRGDGRRSWWWIDSDEGAAWLVRGRRARRVRLP